MDPRVIYKIASANTVKQASKQSSLAESFSKLNPGAKSALIGILGGAGVGLASHLMTPKDKDEDLRKRLLENVLTAAALGGVAGYGGNMLYSALKNSAKKLPPEFGGEDDRNWYERNAPNIGYSDLALAGGAGTGIPAAVALNNARIANNGIERLGGLSSNAQNTIGEIMDNDGVWKEKIISSNPALTDVRKAYNEATNLGLKNKLQQLIPNWRFIPKSLRDIGENARGAQFKVDEELFKKLEAASTTGVSLGDFKKLPKGANPRRIMKAMRLKKIPKGKLGLIALGLILAGSAGKAAGID